MISSSTFHVISTELVVGAFAMSGLCFLLHALCKIEIIKNQKLPQITDNVAHFALLFGILATPAAIFSGISASPGSGFSTPILVNKMFLSTTGLGLALAALVSRWKIGVQILEKRETMWLQTFSGMAASGLMLLTASAGGKFARGESLLDIMSMPYETVLLMPIALSLVLLLSGMVSTIFALTKIWDKSAIQH
jgi:hypothetical protein